MVKQKQLFPVLFLAVVMLVLVAFATWNQSGDLLGQVRFYDSVRGQSLDLHYDDEAETYVLFLPSYASAGDVEHACPEDFTLHFDGEETLEKAEVARDMKLTITAPMRIRRYTLRLERVSAIPTIFVDAEEGLLEYLHADKANTRDVVVRMVDSQGKLMLQGTASMYGRGNGSWESPSKRPYNLEFPKAVTVGPFENVTKLALLADFSDESKLRNSLAYYAGKELGIAYASDYVYTNLYVNGEYLGLYGIVTKQGYQNHVEADGIQAVFEIATGANRVEFHSDLGWRINVMHGSKAQVQKLVATLEKAMVDGDWDTMETIIDVESFAQKYALEEFLANLDLSYASQYFYQDAEGKLHCMLPWDYDWTLGSSFSYYNNLQAYELKVHRRSNSWYGLLLEMEPFREAAVAAWETQFADDFIQKLELHLQESIGLIADSWECDKLRWKNELPYNQFDVSSGVETLEGFYDLFRPYFYQRRAFLTDYYRNQEDYCYVWFYDARWGNLYVPKGTNLSAFLEGATILDVNVPGERFLGWFVNEDEPLEDIGIIDDEVAVRGRYEELETVDTQVSSRWVEICLVLAFGILALAVFAYEWKRIRVK